MNTSENIFAADFRILYPLKSGGMGTVYVVEQLSVKRRRALKVMSAELALNDEFRKRFELEAKIGGSIASDHIVHVLQSGIDAATRVPYIVMELLEGEDLDARFRRGPLGRDDVTSLVQQLFHALSAAHDAGVVHRDLKPENIFLARTQKAGADVEVKVLDFGIAKLAADVTSIKTRAIGTPLWMSPEQCRPGRIDTSSDVWALGLIVFAVLTGRTFWRAGWNDDALNGWSQEVNSDPIPRATARAAEFGAAGFLPYGFDDWFVRCVCREPHARYQNAREAQDALMPLLTQSVRQAARAVLPTLHSRQATQQGQTEPVGPLILGNNPILERAPMAQGALVRDRMEEDFLRDAMRTRRRAQLAVLGGVLAVACIVLYSWLSSKRQQTKARNASWTRLSLCWFGGPPPVGEAALLESIRGAQRTEALLEKTERSSDGASWPLRCARYADDLAETLKSTSETGERDKMDMLFHARDLREHSQSQDPGVLVAKMTELEADAQREGIQFDPGIGGVGAPPQGTSVRAFEELIGAENSLATPMLLLPSSTPVSSRTPLHFYAIRDNRPRVVRIPTKGEPEAQEIPLLSKLPSSQRSGMVLSWGRQVVMVAGEDSEFVLQFGEKEDAWSIRATDGTVLVPKNQFASLGTAVTDSQVYSVVRAAAPTDLSVQGVPAAQGAATIFRLRHDSTKAKRDPLPLPDWTGVDEQAAVVGDWVVWVAKDGGVRGRKVASDDTVAGPLVRVVESDKSGIPALAWRLAEAKVQVCSTQTTLILHVMVPGEATAVTALENGVWNHLGRASGSLTCARNVAYVMGGTVVNECPVGGKCTAHQFPGKQVADAFAGEYVVSFRKVEELLVLQVTSLVSNDTRRLVWDGLMDKTKLRLQGRLESSPRLVSLGENALLAELYVDGRSYLVRIDLEKMNIEPLRVGKLQ